MPGGQETTHSLWSDRLDLATQRGERPAPQDAQDFRMAVLTTFRHLSEFARQNLTPRGKAGQRILDPSGRKSPAGGGLCRDERWMGPSPATKKGFERFRSGGEEDLGESDWQRGAKRVAIASSIVGGDPSVHPRDPDRDGT